MNRAARRAQRSPGTTVTLGNDLGQNRKRGFRDRDAAQIEADRTVNAAQRSVVKPLLPQLSRRAACERRLPRSPIYGAGELSAQRKAGISNFGSCESTRSACAPRASPAAPHRATRV